MYFEDPKERNNELCKLLKIKPILYENCPTCSDYRHDACFYHGCCDGLDLHSTEQVIIDEHIPSWREYGYKIEQYPDFSNPINFLKLLELHFYCFEEIEFDGVSIATGYAKNFQEELVLKFLSYFSPNGPKESKHHGPINLELIVKRAQEIDWYYREEKEY